MSSWEHFREVALRLPRLAAGLEGVVRSTLADEVDPGAVHQFETRNIHPDLPAKVRALYDDGHFAEATFEACKFLDSFVGRHATGTRSGEARMMAAFSETSPVISLNSLTTDSERDEQRGYKFLFAGTMVAIRNPRGHEHSVIDDPGTCLDHLGLVSSLLRRLNEAGFT